MDSEASNMTADILADARRQDKVRIELLGKVSKKHFADAKANKLRWAKEVKAHSETRKRLKALTYWATFVCDWADRYGLLAKDHRDQDQVDSMIQELRETLETKPTKKARK